MISNPGCDEDGGGWAYCTPHPAKAPNNQALGTGPDPCTCSDEWSSPGYANCGETQYGCAPEPVCDGFNPWCVFTNPGCDEDFGGWGYCTPHPCRLIPTNKQLLG